MSPLDLAKHLLSFAAPAFAVALLLALGARLVLPKAKGGGGSWWTSLAINFVAGVGVLVAGLWVFGRDGKMATYAALVVVMATLQWIMGRGWRA